MGKEFGGAAFSTLSPRFRGSGVEHDVGEGATDADQAVSLLELLVGDGEGEVLVDLTLQALLHAGSAGAAAAVVGEAQPGVLGLLQDVLVLGDVHGDAALEKSHFVTFSHQPISISAGQLPAAWLLPCLRFTKLLLAGTFSVNGL